MNFKYLLLFVGSLFYSQEVFRFPADQHSYMGGREFFYRDFHAVVVERNLKQCRSGQDYYSAPVLINIDGTAQLYKSAKQSESDSNCTAKLVEEVVGHMKGWLPAKIEGAPVPAVSYYFIYPDALFENYKDGYDPNHFAEEPIFPGGDKKFREEVLKRIDVSDYYVKGKGKVRLTVRFAVSETGLIEDVRLAESSGMQEYDNMLLRAIIKTRKVWIPGKIHGIPIRSHYVFPISLANAYNESGD